MTQIGPGTYNRSLRLVHEYKLIYSLYKYSCYLKTTQLALFLQNESRNKIRSLFRIKSPQ